MVYRDLGEKVTASIRSRSCTRDHLRATVRTRKRARHVTGRDGSPGRQQTARAPTVIPRVGRLDVAGDDAVIRGEVDAVSLAASLEGRCHRGAVAHQAARLGRRGRRRRRLLPSGQRSGLRRNVLHAREEHAHADRPLTPHRRAHITLRQSRRSLSPSMSPHLTSVSRIGRTTHKKRRRCAESGRRTERPTLVFPSSRARPSEKLGRKPPTIPSLQPGANAHSHTHTHARARSHAPD